MADCRFCGAYLREDSYATCRFSDPLFDHIVKAQPAQSKAVHLEKKEMEFLVAIHHPDGYDGSLESEEMVSDIDTLNEEMKAAGVRVFAGGLRPAGDARSMRARPDGALLVTDGPYLETKEHIGGFWILNCADLDEALAWGRKAVVACRAPVEVRAFI